MRELNTYTPDRLAREEKESLESHDRKENQYLYGQDDAPRNFRSTGKLTTAAEMEAMFLKKGWTITRGEK